jgi:phosphate transport system substrate-binding protein
MDRTRRIGSLAARTALGAVVIVACTGSATYSVVVSGSSTVEPISVRVAELYEDERADVAVTVDGPGTGDGFKMFCAGETDISDASRPIKPEELEDCEAHGVEFIELEVAFDGLTVITSTKNEHVSCLTFADLYALAGVEADGEVGRWSDAEALAAELGSTTPLPDVDLTLVGPGPESGTYDSFIELALKDPAEARLEAGAITEGEAERLRKDYSSQSDDNAILTQVDGAAGSLGWVGFAFANDAGESVRELAIDGGDGCVEPSAATIADGEYPLSRLLYIYVNAESADDPRIADYVDFYLGGDHGAVEQVGYVPLPDDRAAANREIWAQRTTGTRVEG